MVEYSRVSENARKIETIILNGLASVGQAHVAEQLDVNESTVSRLKDRETPVSILAIAVMLDYMGLKVVPKESRTYRPADIEAILHLAKRAMSTMQTVEDLAVNGND